MKYFVLGLLLVAIMAGSVFAFETIDGKDVSAIDGEVVVLDTADGRMTVRWLQDEIQVLYDQMTLAIGKDTRVMKGTDTITIDDINVGDMVTAKFYRRGYSLPKAVQVIVAI